MTDQEVFDLAKDLDSIGHEQKNTIRFIFLEKRQSQDDWLDFMRHFSGKRLISLSHKSVYSCIAHYEPKDETGWAERYYKGRTLEGPWAAVLEEIQTIKDTFPNLKFIIRETDEHISYHRIDDIRCQIWTL
jgi:hypothetical protein